MSKFNAYGWHGDVMAALAGLAMPLAFAPYHLFPLAILSLAVLFLFWRGVSAWRGFWRGWLYGLGMFGGGVHWIHISLAEYGGVAMPAAIALTALLVMFLALYPAGLGYLVVRLFPHCNRVRLLLVTPALWTLLEWLRSWLISGFPWLSVGYSQIDSPLAGLAPLSGVYGVSWGAAFTASLLVYAFLAGRRRVLRHVLPALVALWGFAWLLNQVDWARPSGEPLQVTIVQANVAQELKWEAALADEVMERYLELSRQHPEADLVVWPETAIYPFRHDAQLFLAELENERLYQRTNFLLGIREHDLDTDRYYNSVINISEGPRSSYRKRHLVPFGEYTPFRSLVGTLLHVLNVPQYLDFSPGDDEQELLTAAKQSIGVSICYEDVFPNEVRRALPFATLLVNVSNDAWFGDSIAPHQHLQIARMRALENGRYLIRATNTGVSAIIDNKGKIVAQAPQFEVGTVSATVQPLEAGTPYALAGNLQLFFIMLVCFLVGIILHYYWHPPQAQGWRLPSSPP